MKVKELIQKLLALNPEAEVIAASPNFELEGVLIAVSSVRQLDQGSKKMETFRDAFDGGTYEAETWSTIGGDLPVVTIS